MEKQQAPPYQTSNLWGWLLLLLKVVAIFAKNRSPEFKIFFQKFKNGVFFLLLADFSYCTKR